MAPPRDYAPALPLCPDSSAHADVSKFAPGSARVSARHSTGTRSLRLRLRLNYPDAIPPSATIYRNVARRPISSRHDTSMCALSRHALFCHIQLGNERVRRRDRR
jgi:hypothetical protein